MDDKLIYYTDTIRLGRHDWRVEVREIDGSKCPVPVFRRVGDNGPWNFPANFSGSLPSGLVNFVLQNSVAIGRALG